MARSYPFDELTATGQQQASARFIEAGAEDGFRYELDADGKVLSRFRPTVVRGQPAPIYASGCPVRQSTD